MYYVEGVLKFSVLYSVIHSITLKLLFKCPKIMSSDI